MFILWMLGYRFVTGLHMDGKTRRLPQSTKVKPQFKNWWWNRTTRPRRAGIRLLVVCVIGGLAIGRLVDWWLTSFVGLAVLPFALIVVLRILLRKFTTVTTFHDSDGAPDRYRSLRPQYARKVRAIRYRRFKLSPPSTDVIQPGTPEYMNALAENAEDGLPPVTRMSRPLGHEDMLTELATPEDERGGSSRGRTIRRAVERRARR